jgi:hypothetical protein
MVGAIAWNCSACKGSSQNVCRPDPTTGSELCQTTGGDYVAAAVVTGAAAAVYTVTGCTWNGCQLPDRCNPVSKRCETIRCSESHACPAGYSCDLSDGMCR